MKGLPVLALTMGDPAGIGPEIALAAARSSEVRRACRPLLVGCREVFRRRGWTPRAAPLLDPGIGCEAIPGRPTAQGGAASFQAVRLAIGLAVRGLVDGVVTAPISKAMWRAAGVAWADHTDYIKDATRSREVAMMLVCGERRAVLVTRHLPLKEVVRRVKRGEIVRAAALAHRALKNDLGLARPELGLCALNPHAGEDGLLGAEERRALRPAARILRRRGVAISDPLPADSAWGCHKAGRFDALVCLYHDQALIALKAIDRFKIVNWTLGAPIVRTSPGHGTAFDIAGRKGARPDAMIEAALLAARLVSAGRGGLPG